MSSARIGEVTICLLGFNDVNRLQERQLYRELQAAISPDTIC
jgi:hypothetical protein